MKNKKNFNNLFDSVCLTILLIFLVVFYSLVMWYGVLNASDDTSPMATFVIFTLIFGAMISILIFVIIKGCYEYWVLTDRAIYSKKLFRKKTIIDLSQIIKVEKKNIPALVMGTYRSDAYIVHSDNCTIYVLIDGKKNLQDLERELNIFVTNS